MQFNTVILYDIENLIGGYKEADMLSNLSLKDVHNEIQKKDIGKIAIQRAYANWANTRLNILRNDIVELGIEPIQMFGFGRGPQKNASDIQLVIDAIDIAFTRKAIDIFVIVSGDGGFSALAKKLHEYGCMVIGCAYRNTTNRVFESVCDDFIWIDKPKSEYVFIQNQSKSDNEKSEFTNPILENFSRSYGPVVLNHEQIIKDSVEILNYLAGNISSRQLLRSAGLNISVFKQLLSYRIKDFDHIKLGFTKFTDFIRYVSSETQIKLIHNPPSEYRLLLKDFSINTFSDVEPIIEWPKTHSLENYKLLLAKENPKFHIPNRGTVFEILNYLSDNKIEFQNILIEDILERLAMQLYYDKNSIKEFLISLISAGCFIKKSEEKKLTEQKLSFIPESYEQSLNILKKAMFDKIKELLGEVKDDIFSKIIYEENESCLEYQNEVPKEESPTKTASHAADTPVSGME